jgi:hypothetical protein
LAIGSLRLVLRPIGAQAVLGCFALLNAVSTNPMCTLRVMQWWRTWRFEWPVTLLWIGIVSAQYRHRTAENPIDKQAVGLE